MSVAQVEAAERGDVERALTPSPLGAARLGVVVGLGVLGLLLVRLVGLREHGGIHGVANGNKQDLQKIYYEKASAYRRMTGESFEPPACDHQ
jgi:hypothetical protein